MLQLRKVLTFFCEFKAAASPLVRTSIHWQGCLSLMTYDSRHCGIFDTNPIAQGRFIVFCGLSGSLVSQALLLFESGLIPLQSGIYPLIREHLNFR